MPHIELRAKSGARSPEDIVLNVQDKTYDYLRSSPAAEIRISAFLDQDWPRIEAMYSEVFVHEDCAFQSKITRLIPGSRTRKNIELPAAMEEGEQLTILVTRTPTGT